MQVAFTPKGLPEPGAPPVPEKTLSRWALFLGSIAVGVPLAEAMMKHFMTRADIESCIRSSNEQRQAWDEARLAALKRTWSAFEFEDIFERIASGMPVGKAIAAVRGGDEAHTSAFNRIILADSVLNEQYMRALAARSLVMQEEIVELADDNSEDVIHNDKGPAPNNAAVNRSKLQVETRLRLMAAWHKRMFGEKQAETQVNVQVNYAERLEDARARATVRAAVPKALSRDVVEAAFSEVSTIGDTSWLETPTSTEPMDTAWLES